VFFRYRSDQPDIPGTGAQLAEHLAQRYELEGLSVEETEPHRDHFDANAPAVRLSPENYHGRSLTAIAVAAHEIGHAIQCYRQEPVFRLRKRYIPLARRLQQVGFLLLSISPILGVVTRSPVGLALPIAGGILAALCGAFVYLIVLPEEWDASFYKALPLLREGNYISEAEEPAVRRILRAAALTYFAAALASIVQVWRWMPLLLRR
ncbi:MAG: zinc metallopeptidase, partial [Granulosicoccus sp.]|nr:zinc metallopeptidase [Granulosicoccus sp.]